MRHALASAALLCLAACKKDPPPEQRPAGDQLPFIQNESRLSKPERNAEGDFWAWFAAHSEELDQVEKHQDQTFDALSAELEKVEPGLTFQFGPKEKGARELVISADGIQKRFPAVKRLVAAAPKDLKGWKIVAFRQRDPGDFEIEFKGTGAKLSAKGVWFKHAPLERGEKIDVTLYVPGWREDQRAQLGQIAYLLLDSQLGEYDTETRLGAIEFEALPQEPAKRGLKPLTALPALVDSNFP